MQLHPNSLANIGKGRTGPNKFTQLKNDFLYAFKKIGGRKELAAWGMLPCNRDTFYKLVISLLPKEMKLEADINHGTRVLMVPAREFQDGTQVGADKPKEAIQQPEKVTITPLLTHQTIKDK